MKETKDGEVAEVECEVLIPLPRRGGHTRRVVTGDTVRITAYPTYLVVADRDTGLDAVCVPLSAVRWWRWKT